MSSKPRAPRKKKETTVASEPATDSNVTVPAPVPAPAPVEAPTKKSKKPVKVIAVVTPEGIEGTFVSEPRRPLIAHLRIKSNDIAFHDQEFTYNPAPPKEQLDVEPYDAGADDVFTAGQEELLGGVEVSERPVAKQEPQAVEPPVAAAAPAASMAPAQGTVAPLPCFYKADLMVQFKDTAEAKMLPPKTEIACFWCAHTFETMPCVIPEREIGGTYQVYGNFCCPECAVSYLLSETVDPHVRWERMALLQRIYDHEGTGRIFPAPARETLQLFGGPMSIECFRATVRGGKVRVDVHMPPMVSILGHIDTKPIDFFDTNTKNGSLTIPMDKVSKAEEGLRLKRSKPLKDKESTLDTVMNIQISRR